MKKFFVSLAILAMTALSLAGCMDTTEETTTDGEETAPAADVEPEMAEEEAATEEETSEEAEEAATEEETSEEAEEASVEATVEVTE